MPDKEICTGRIQGCVSWGAFSPVFLQEITILGPKKKGRTPHPKFISVSAPCLYRFTLLQTNKQIKKNYVLNIECLDVVIDKRVAIEDCVVEDFQ